MPARLSNYQRQMIHDRGTSIVVVAATQQIVELALARYINQIYDQIIPTRVALAR